MKVMTFLNSNLEKKIFIFYKYKLFIYILIKITQLVVDSSISKKPS
jgi:hypothetical protein